MVNAAHADGWVPDWPVPPGVHALCTTRQGGHSVAPYDSLNLGNHVGDDPAAVLANRQVLQSALQARTPGARAIFLSQVHGVDVVDIDLSTPNGTEADACATTASGAACTIMVADCLPVLFAHRSGAVVAAAHAGWRGLAGEGGWGVLESAFKRFNALAHGGKALAAIKTEAIGLNASSWSGTAGAPPVAADTLAWLGPCIGPQAFEVGTEVRAAFCDADAGAQACFVPRPDAEGKFLCDLAGLARRRLQALGITQIYGNNSTAPWCTVANASTFFSHRRDSVALGGSGRFAACIWRD